MFSFSLTAVWQCELYVMQLPEAFVFCAPETMSLMAVPLFSVVDDAARFGRDCLCRFSRVLGNSECTPFAGLNMAGEIQPMYSSKIFTNRVVAVRRTWAKTSKSSKKLRN